MDLREQGISSSNKQAVYVRYLGYYWASLKQFKRRPARVLNYTPGARETDARIWLVQEYQQIITAGMSRREKKDR